MTPKALLGFLRSILVLGLVIAIAHACGGSSSPGSGNDGGIERPEEAGAPQLGSVDAAASLADVLTGMGGHGGNAPIDAATATFASRSSAWEHVADLQDGMALGDFEWAQTTRSG